jgi:diguanylate cyclase (GGDEF)-like protein/PAS domain S-box-containing protein
MLKLKLPGGAKALGSEADGGGDRSERIVSAAFLTMVIFAVLLVGLAALGEYMLVQSATTARLSRENRKDSLVLDSTLDHRTRRAEVAASSEQVVGLAQLPREQALTLAAASLDHTLQFLHASGFVSISVRRSDGVTLQSGTPLPANTFSLAVRGSAPSRILWQDGFFLETVHPIVDGLGTPLGTMLAQQQLITWNDMFRQDLAFGRTNNLLICGRSSAGLACISNRFAKAPFLLITTAEARTPARRAAARQQEDQRAQPMEDALAGGGPQTLTWLRTPNGRTVFSASAIGTTGLAHGNAVAEWETMTQMNLQLGASLVAIAVLLALGRALLGQTIAPLVRTMLAEQERAGRNERQFVAAVECSLSSFFLLEAARDANDQIFDFRFVYLNERGEKMVRRKTGDLKGKLLCEEVPINRTQGFYEKYKQVVLTGHPFTEDFHVEAPNIDAAWLSTQVVKCGDGVAVTCTDFTERKRMEQRLEESSRFTQAVIDASPFSTIVTDAEGLIVAANPASERMLWYSKSEMEGMSALALHDPAEVNLRAAELSAEMGAPVQPTMEAMTTRARRGFTDEGQWTYIRKDGSRFPVQLTVTALFDGTLTATGYLAIAYDITERKRQEDYISHIAHHDSLTGLPTRMLFIDRVDVAIKRIQRYGGSCALMLIDLDNFKDVNDSLGHHAGDDVLTAVGRRLTETLRSMDTVSRMGGDEYTVLLDDIESEQDAATTAEKLLAALARPMQIGEEVLSISASIGISVYPVSGTTSSQLLRHADAAMYHAKGSGRHSYRFFSQGLADASSKRLQIEMALKKAVDASEFTVVYQPQVSLLHGEIVGVEALVRWTSDRLGTVSPAEFIPLAEQCGVIGPLGEWVLRTACTDIHALCLATGVDLRLAVNLSPRQLEREDFPGRVASILRDTKFPAERLEIEITEGVLMDDSLQVWDGLHELQQLGIQMAIDDFGTGFSNISYLLKLAVNRIKIDRSFITDLETDAGCKAVVTSLVGMASNLGVTVIAEGVETEGQGAILRDKGCHEAQGYFFHRPMPAAELKRILALTLTPQ